MTNYAEMTWPEAKELIPSKRGVIIALGSIEEHGPHMPLGTDMYLGEYVAKRIAKETDCLCLPVLPFGYVWSGKDFPGAIALSADLLRDLLFEISDNLIRHGAKNIIMVTGHSGNLNSMKDAARRLHDERNYNNVYFYAYPKKRQLAEGIMESPFWNDMRMHAAEMETSMLLSVYPELVHMDRAIKEYPPVPLDNDCCNVPWVEFCKSGVFGDSTIATKEKGVEYVDRLINYIINSINNNVKY